MSAEVLRAFCDTVVPVVEDDGDDVTGAFLRRPASALGIETLLAGPDVERALAALGAGFADEPLDARIARVHAAAAGEDGRCVRRLRSQVLALAYGLVDGGGRNANWEAIGYPGPTGPPPSPEEAPKAISVLELSPGTATLRADACVVGSGAGGAVIAARLQEAGLDVLVLEQGAYRNESDFRQLELVGAQELYLGGGVIWSESGSLGLLAGSTLGGGTVVNSLVCLRTPDHVRHAWAAAGLDGVDGAEFDACLDTVWARLGVNTRATIPNPSNQRMTEALDRTGGTWELLPRNAGPHDPRHCGYCNAGCQQGAKNSTLKTYLQDAADAGARFVVGCRAERVRVQDGRAVGVDAVVTHPDGSATALTVDAPLVVVAGGGIESPALLLRSGLGGPAAGQGLRVHPAWFVTGIYPERLDAWSGQIQSVVSFDFAQLEHGDGFLCECVILSPTFWAASMRWEDGERHKREMLKLARAATWHGVSHDHGAGRVTVDADGRAAVHWELDDERDRLTSGRAYAELARLHRAGGAEEIYTFDPPGLRWRHGEDFEAFTAQLEGDAPRVAYSAHQMGSCAMGTDPAASVADPDGRLHDVAGVWIGDGSALPTAPGVNPMITIMALAERTATRLLRHADAAAAKSGALRVART
jgi:choline dehydrogenase-like flavoprotein